ncbi:hypothetical protein ACFW21_08830 [Streptomyces albogriseolus]|uniref:hypothetical protein n=1 Tax=Streptomyces albogriseolus TaxID=1887 RepID=UPI0036B2CB38
METATVIYQEQEVRLVPRMLGGGFVLFLEELHCSAGPCVARHHAARVVAQTSTIGDRSEEAVVAAADEKDSVLNEVWKTSRKEAANRLLGPQTRWRSAGSSAGEDNDVWRMPQVSAICM